MNEAIERALAEDGEAARRRRAAIAAENTWDRRASRLLDLVGERMEP